MTESELLAAALAGDRRALARLLSRVEAGGAGAEAILQALSPRASGAHIVGLTGAPGTGKSTLAGQLAREWRRRKQTVAIVAVDPTSPLTGGALLGDRIRMGGLAGDEGVFVRSMASRGAGGGLAEQTAAVATVLAGAGFDIVLIETVGVGQDELAVAQEAQTTVVLAAPGLGDEIQALKAGILEVADILVVNKADREGADRLVAELRFAVTRGGKAPAAGRQSQVGGLGVQGSGRSLPTSPVAPGLEGQSPAVMAETGDWRVPVLKTVATTGEGVPELVDAIGRHRAWLCESGAAGERRRALAERAILRCAAAKAVRVARARAEALAVWPRLLDDVAAGRLSPQAAADVLLDLRPGLPQPRTGAGRSQPGDAG